MPNLFLSIDTSVRRNMIVLMEKKTGPRNLRATTSLEAGFVIYRFLPKRAILFLFMAVFQDTGPIKSKQWEV